MLIGIDAHQATRQVVTGTEYYAAQLMRAIAQRDSDDQFLLYSHASLPPALQRLATNFRSRVLLWPPRRGWTQTRLAAEMLLRPPDVLFVPSHTPPFIHPAATVTTVHDLGFLRSPQIYARFERFYNAVMQQLAIRVARIITPSAFTKSELLHFFPSFPEDRIAVIAHGFTAEVYHPIEDEGRIRATAERYGLHEPYFLFTGRIQEKKNIPRLLEAFHLLHRKKDAGSVQLLLAGRPDFDFRDIGERIRQLGLAGRVFAPGYVPLDDLATLMNGATAFVYVSLYEGFGFPVLEAQACGTPVLMSNVASLPEIGGNGALAVDPTNVEEIAEGMTRMLADAALRTALRERGFKNLERFSWSRCADQTLHTLRTARD